MKNIKILTISLFAICGLLLPSLSEGVNAGAGYEAFYVSSVNKNSASIHGGDSIQLTVRSQAYDCGGQHYEFRASPDDCIVMTTGPNPLVGMPLEVSVEMAGGTVSPSGTVTTDNSGYARFTLASTTPGQKTVIIKGYPTAARFVQVGSQVVTFTNSSATTQSSPPTSNSSSAGSSNRPTASASSSQRPTTDQAQSSASSGMDVSPQVQEVKIGGLALNPSASDDALPTIQQSKSLKLSGKTMPNTDVIIYIFSEPKMFKTKSDASGNWSVDIKDLPIGTHHAEFEAIDPASGQPLPRVQLGYFKVQPASTAKNTASTSESAISKSNTSKAVLTGGLLVIAIIGVGYVAYIKKIKNKRTAK